MAVSVYIPSPFRKLTANRDYVAVEGSNVAEVLDAVNAQYPGFDMLVYDAEGRIPQHITIYLNNQAIHEMDGTSTQVKDGDQVAVIPALAGGSDSNGAAASTALTPDEVMRLPEDSALVFVAGHPAIYARKIRYYADPEFCSRAAVLAPSESDRIEHDWSHWTSRAVPRVLPAVPAAEAQTSLLTEADDEETETIRPQEAF